MVGGCIFVLPSDLADQIAAGEVVERPASVVKELVENSLDAGATRIEIEIEGGGRRSIRVVDNGSGMNERDARLSLTRHATSKLRKLDDLVALGTMGFRGEALPSIAAVSRFSLTTRPAGAVAGLCIEVAGGQVTDEHEAGAPVGTCIEVRDLMWNVPARLKFLKAEPTEAGHVSETTSRLAMAHPEVAFRLRSGSRLALDLPVHQSMLERVQAIVGRRLSAKLFASEHEEEGVYVRCFLAPPELSQSTSRGLKFYAGKRSIRDRGLLHAVFMGYSHLIPKGRYANAIIMIDAPDGAVDINVHPQKLEVRFAQAQKVYAAVRHAVAAAVAKTPWLAQPAGSAGTPGFGAGWKSVTPLRPKNGEKDGTARASELAMSYADRQERLLFSGRERPINDGAVAGAVATAGQDADPEQVADGYFSRLGYIGQLDRTYLVCESQAELVLVDQHAAHERVVFERLRGGAR